MNRIVVNIKQNNTQNQGKSMGLLTCHAQHDKNLDLCSASDVNKVLLMTLDENFKMYPFNL